jgi:hypothetical protein
MSSCGRRSVFLCAGAATVAAAAAVAVACGRYWTTGTQTALDHVWLSVSVLGLAAGVVAAAMGK